MAEEQKNSSAETVDAAASAAHTVKGAIKAGKAISGAAKGAAAGGPYGAVAGAVWAGRKHIGKIIAIIAILLLLPVLFLLMLPGLIFGGLVNAFSPADPDTPTGLLCDAYNTAELGDQDCTKIYIMEKQRFPQWLTEHKTSLKSISDF